MASGVGVRGRDRRKDGDPTSSMLQLVGGGILSVIDFRFNP